MTLETDLALIFGNSSPAQRMRAEKRIAVLLGREMKDLETRVQASIRIGTKIKEAVSRNAKYMNASLSLVNAIYVVLDECGVLNQTLAEIITFRQCNPPEDARTIDGPLAFQTHALLFVGKDAERSIRFGLYLLERVAPLVISYWKEEDPDSSSEESLRNAYSAHAFIRMAWSVSTSKTSCKGWILKILEAAASNEAARTVMLDLFEVAALGPQQGPLPVLISEEAFEDEEETTEAITVAAYDYDRFGPITIILPELHTGVLLQIKSAERTKNEDARKEAESLFGRIRINKDALDKVSRQLWTDIAANHLRWIRPEGKDRVAIDASALRAAGIRSFNFHAEGSAPPKIGLQLLVRRQVPQLVPYTIEIDPNKSEGNCFTRVPERLRSVFQGLGFSPDDVLDLLSLVVCDVLYRLTVPPPDPSHAGPVVQASETDGEKTIPVRPHTRPLRPGHKASAKMIARSIEETGAPPPTGRTYVPAFYRKGALEYRLPPPITTYTAEDLRRLIG
jgi:hypothetical protein